MKVFRITAVEWGNGRWPFSRLEVQVDRDERRVVFEGDAFWQWVATPFRNHDQNCSWAQALHDALEGWHSTVLHEDETLTVLPHHPDWERVRALVEDVDAGRSLPRLLEEGWFENVH